MQFTLTPEQAALADAVRSLVERRARTTDARAAAAGPAGYDKQLWRQLAGQVGAAGLAVPERYGGAGCTLFETHLVLQELGAALTPSPLLGSAVLTAQAVLLAGDETAAARLLPGLATGHRIGALAWADAAGRWRTDGSEVRAGRDGDGWRLHGTAHLVLGDRADVLLAVARTDGGAPALFEVPAGAAQWRPTPGVDPLLRFATVRFADAPATPLCLAAGPLLERLHDLAAVAVTAIQVGAAGAALDRTRRYLLEREQFGRPLGSFQALKHRMADMLVAVETARSVSWAAAWAAADGSPDLGRRAAVAKAWCTEAFEHVAAEMIQLHGGIAITWEHDAHLFFKRAHATGQLFGAAHEHRRRLLAHV